MCRVMVFWVFVIWIILIVVIIFLRICICWNWICWLFFWVLMIFMFWDWLMKIIIIWYSVLFKMCGCSIWMFVFCLWCCWICFLNLISWYLLLLFFLFCLKLFRKRNVFCGILFMLWVVKILFRCGWLLDWWILIWCIWMKRDMMCRENYWWKYWIKCICNIISSCIFVLW